MLAADQPEGSLTTCGETLLWGLFVREPTLRCQERNPSVAALAGVPAEGSGFFLATYSIDVPDVRQTTWSARLPLSYSLCGGLRWRARGVVANPDTLCCIPQDVT